MSAARGVAALAIVIIGLIGCGGGEPPAAHPLAVADAGEASAPPQASTLDTDGVPSLDALAARGSSDAPLMRELLRVSRLAARSVLPRADRDLCMRAVFASNRELRVWFVDDSGTMRGEAATTSNGTAPPRGPACAKKGETLVLVVDAHGAEVAGRAVIFAAP